MIHFATKFTLCAHFTANNQHLTKVRLKIWWQKVTITQDKDKVNPKWIRQHARIFCHIDVDQKTHIQKVEEKKEIDADLFYVFVDVGAWIDQDVTNLFTLSHKEAALVFGQKYFKAWDGKKRGNNPDTDDFWIEYEDVMKFRDLNLKRILEK